MVVQADVDAPVGTGLDVDRLCSLLVLAVLAVAPVASGLILWSAPGASDDINQRISVSLYDIPLFLLVVVRLADLIEHQRPTLDPRRWSFTARTVGVTIAWLLVAALIHPSWRAIDLGFHLAGAWAIAWTVRRADAGDQNLFLSAAIVLGTFEAVLGIAQSLTGGPLGIGLIELGGPLYEFGGSHAGRGTLTHPYHLAALLLVCISAAAVLVERLDRRRDRLLLASAVLTMLVGLALTFSRAALLALVPMVAILVLRGRIGPRLAVVLLAGLAIGGAIGAGGVVSKVTQSSSADAIDTERRVRLQEAGRLVAEDPVFGVGPGRYVIALTDVEHQRRLPAHNVVAHAAAEAGVLGGVLVFASFTALGGWLIRHGALSLVAGISLMPFFLLDAYPYVFPFGIIVSGMWITTVLLAADQDKRR